MHGRVAGLGLDLGEAADESCLGQGEYVSVSWEPARDEVLLCCGSIGCGCASIWGRPEKPRLIED